VLVFMLQSPFTALATGESESPSFEAAGVQSVSVDAEHLDVELVGDAGLFSTLTGGVTVESPSYPQGYRVVHDQVGGTLRIWVDRGPFSWPRGRDRLVVHLPQGVNARISSVSGSIRADGLTADRFAFSSTSGRIELRAIEGAVDASSVSGRITLDSVKGRFAAKTVSGAIRGVALEPTANASFNSVSGSIDVSFATPLEDLRFDLSSVSGSITADRVRAARGLRMGEGDVVVIGRTISGSQVYR